ncbi:NUDIX hydrolase domain-like protein [Aspergillus pseudoustus]|uniref:NUDIX hydrolase domain-like protein n=1 Tax=Aspergillus pseudoustus TaxID=1810923 RepID=A0ABR4KM12_9EURO
MTASHFPTTQFSSENFVESCGAILFDLSQPTKRVCLIQYRDDEWLLPKGRRNVGESRHAAALRETQEETGYKCRIHPVTMLTRAPRADDPEDAPDSAQLCAESTEPFMLTIRELPGGSDVKIIWWYIAVFDEEGAGAAPTIPEGFSAQFFTCDEALQRLNFRNDRDVLAKAMGILEQIC